MPRSSESWSKKTHAHHQHCGRSISWMNVNGLYERKDASTLGHLQAAGLLVPRIWKKRSRPCHTNVNAEFKRCQNQLFSVGKHFPYRKYINWIIQQTYCRAGEQLPRRGRPSPIWKQKVSSRHSEEHWFLCVMCSCMTVSWICKNRCTPRSLQYAGQACFKSVFSWLPLRSPPYSLA